MNTEQAIRCPTIPKRCFFNMQNEVLRGDVLVIWLDSLDTN